MCPLPWNHFSANIDSSMRICCNTDNGGFILNPEGHRVYLQDIHDVRDYFNIPFLKNIRKQMISGERPAICRKCYQIEDAGGRSCRQDYFDAYKGDQGLQNSILLTAPDGTAKPRITYIDFALSNRCNIRCLMCSPHASHLLAEDFKELGIYYDEEWESRSRNYWTPEKIVPVFEQIVDALQSMLTTGGEPFINATHLLLLETAIKRKRSHEISLSYHTNLMVLPEKLVELWRSFKRVDVHVSLEGFGPLNEYIRHGSKWAVIEKNFQKLIALKKEINLALEVHTCLQVPNLLRLPDLYGWLERWENECPPLPYHISIDHPLQLQIGRLPKELQYKAVENIRLYMEKHRERFAKSHYPDWTAEKVRTLESHLRLMLDAPWNQDHWNETVSFIKTLEKIRKTRLVDIVPELAPYF